MFFYDGNHMFWGWGLVMMVLWIGALLMFAWFLGSLLSNQRRERPVSNAAPDDPELIAKRRYAHGDISREEYLKLIEDLKYTHS